MSTQRAFDRSNETGMCCTPGRFGRRLASLALACALLPLAGCPLGNGGHAGADLALAHPDAPLAWTVNAVRTTRRLDTSSLETKQAAPGDQFIVLDVSVRNRDAQPQVLPEGKLIAMNETQLQTFDTPVTLLSDDYLSLQVLSPAQQMRGKIAYEVPEHLPGVVYWSPGNGDNRILLDLPQTAGESRALAAVDDDRPAVSPDIEAKALPPATSPRTARQTVVAAAPLPVASTAANARRSGVHATPIANPPTTAAPSNEASVPVVAAGPSTDPDARSPFTTSAGAMVQAPASEVATVSIPQPILSAPALPVSPAREQARQPDIANAEHARRLACDGFTRRDDPSESARNLGYFATHCRDHSLPAHWRPSQTLGESLLVRAKSLITRIVAAPRVSLVSSCDASQSPADRLVCRDASLAAMDHRLAQSVAQAREHVGDPAALQRDQQLWRERVRDACDTVDCLQSAYGRRIAQLDALAPMRP